MPHQVAKRHAKLGCNAPNALFFTGFTEVKKGEELETVIWPL